jgi:predicted permease
LALKDPRRLLHLWRTSASDHTQPLFFFSYGDYLKFAHQSRSFSSMSATFYRSYTLTGRGNPEAVMGETTTANLFQTLGVGAALGRTFSPQDATGEKVALISHALWTEKFGASASIIGQTIRLNDEPYRVIGVLPRSFSYRILDQPVDAAIWTVIQRNDREYQQDSNAAVAILGRLRPRMTRSRAQVEMNLIQQRIDKERPQLPDAFLGTATLLSALQDDNARSIRFSLIVLACATGFLLLIACANTSALILSRNAARHSEFAVRIALGSGAWRLFQQLLAESFLLYAAAALVGFAAAHAIVRGFDVWNPLGILPPGGLALDHRASFAAASFALLSALLFGTLPAFFASKPDLNAALRAMGRSHTPHPRRVHALTWITGAQIALALVFLAGAGLLFSTLLNLENQNFGFQTAQVLTLELSLPNKQYGASPQAIAFEERLTERFRETPGVTAAAVGLDLTAGDEFPEVFTISDRPSVAAANLPRAAQTQIGPQFFQTVKIPILQGSDFPLHLSPNSEPHAIINELVAQRYFPRQNPIGQHLRFGVPTDPHTAQEPWYRIIGVVGDTRSIAYNQTLWKYDPVVYVDFRQERGAPLGVSNWNSRRCNFLIAAASRDALPLRKVQRIVWSLDPALPLGRFDPLDARLMAHLAQPKLRAQVLSGFSGISLLLAAIGLYGILSQTVAQGKREIAIRVALGADRRKIVRLVVRRAISITAVGVVTGTALAFTGARAVRSILYGVSPLNPALYVGATCVLFAIALLAAFVPARRAASVDPIINLRAE